MITAAIDFEAILRELDRQGGRVAKTLAAETAAEEQRLLEAEEQAVDEHNAVELARMAS